MIEDEEATTQTGFSKTILTSFQVVKRQFIPCGSGKLCLCTIDDVLQETSQPFNFLPSSSP